GTVHEGDMLHQGRVGGLWCLMGQQQESVAQAEAGSIVALMRMDEVRTGDTLSADADLTLPKAEVVTPVYALAIAPERHSDDVKLSGALTKLVDEDPSLRWEHHGDTHEVILWGQGDIQLKIALDRLRNKYGLAMTTHLPHVPYRETIHQSAAAVHGRYKRQSGGHGQFGDVSLDISPLPRGSGITFGNIIVGGIVPKQYIPGVESGVREYLNHGPLGFPVVDVSVTLVNGSYHAVDSSEQAFRQAARLAMQEGLSACEPSLLEPILTVTVSVPTAFTANALRLISTRRGQILGYGAKPGWQGWDEVSAYLPQAEMQDFIIELRSTTMGVGSFCWQYDHLQEVPDKLTQRILTKQAEESELVVH
ncbi:MAG: elongation factor G, partial [Elainellaceae cyanobacterium]